jgi:hypothetical protein
VFTFPPMTPCNFLRRLGLATGVSLTLLALALPARGQRGALTRPRNLAQLLAQSATIVRGYVASARVEPHPDLHHLSTVVVTLKVAETLKGEARQTFTFRQFIWDIRDRYDAAGYRKGQHLLLLLNPPTRYGLSSPAGLEQGRFRITRDAQGREMATNGRGNAGLFRGLATQLDRKRVNLGPRVAALVHRHQTGPIALDDLRELTRQLQLVNLE